MPEEQTRTRTIVCANPFYILKCRGRSRVLSYPTQTCSASMCACVSILFKNQEQRGRSPECGPHCDVRELATERLRAAAPSRTAGGGPQELSPWPKANTAAKQPKPKASARQLCCLGRGRSPTHSRWPKAVAEGNKLPKAASGRRPVGGRSPPLGEAQSQIECVSTHFLRSKKKTPPKNAQRRRRRSRLR